MIYTALRLIRALAAEGLLFSFLFGCLLRLPFASRKHRRPIFVMSPAGSGSTWIATLLGHLPSHVYIHEVKLGGGRSRGIWSAILMLRPMLPGRLLFILVEAFERARLWTIESHSRNFAKPRRELVTEVNLGPFDPKRPRQTHEAVDVIDSAGSNITIAPLLRKAYPNAILSFIVRDPRDTCLSCCYRKPFGHQNSIDGWARSYVRTYDKFKEYRESCRIDELRYEDWVNDTRGQMRAFLDRHGLTMTDTAIEEATFQHDQNNIRAGKTVTAGNLSQKKPAGWRRDLSEADRAAITPILESTIMECGYEWT